jgi:release factor glutamine methyltransferase
MSWQPGRKLSAWQPLVWKNNPGGGDRTARVPLEKEHTCLGAIYSGLRQQLAALSQGSPPGSASLDAQVLLAHILQKPRAWVLAHPEAHLSVEQQQELRQAVERLTAGEPLPYILETQEFFGLVFKVSRATLIPRPETELLVEHALAWLKLNPGRCTAADVGTGSGCIAVCLAVHAPWVRVLAADISWEALRTARLNIHRHQVHQKVQLIQADLLPASPQSIDLLCANLPYIPTAALRGLEVYGREPALALDGGEDGLQVIRRLLARARQFLAPGGLALFEIEATQGDNALRLGSEIFPGAAIQIRQDLAGHDRLLVIEEQG